MKDCPGCKALLDLEALMREERTMCPHCGQVIVFGRPKTVRTQAGETSIEWISTGVGFASFKNPVMVGQMIWMLATWDGRTVTIAQITTPMELTMMNCLKSLSGDVRALLNATRNRVTF